MLFLHIIINTRAWPKQFRPIKRDPLSSLWFSLVRQAGSMDSGSRQLRKVLLLIVILATCSGNETITVDVVVILFTGNSIYGDTRILPALEIARETISHRVERGEYANFTLRWVYSEQGCSRGRVAYASGIAAQLYFERNVVAYFGPPCSIDMQSVADFAASMNIPIFSGSAGSHALESKRRYPTLTSTVNKVGTMVSFLEELLKFYGWDSIVLIVKGILFGNPGNAIEDGLRESGIRAQSFYFSWNDDTKFESTLRQAKSISRSK